MRNIITVFVIALTALLFGCTENSGPVKGKQYDLLPVSLVDYQLAPVTEVFSLNCGHCKQMENNIPKLEQLTGQSIGKVHVTFNESAKVGAMIYYAAETQLGKTPDHDMMTEFFAATQMGDGATLTDKKNAIDIVFHSRELVSPYDFNENQQQQLFDAMEKAHNVTTLGQINAVPTFIVNGKYQILTGGHSDIASIANTMNFLLTQP
ncbi:thiol-disulfide isomerase and thioredoxin [Vibrio galatheae]|uniref:Thiol-disulfide isomerase and thioredoxin n=1 Tax=Vibrio galatheae TaxID=579748 RepID=A0A0F4NM76_9VIBR|nr:thioredoxin domain-containing protein [Vibrio galatheae]KJY83948.1 thiol-disulfide isomerase and thioredoxin [Vibrio galatheae]